MTPTAAVLILISAVVHAGWNLLGKREHPSSAFFLVANTIGFLCLAPVALVYRQGIPEFPASVWALIALTGICQSVYMAALAGAYRRGQMSIVYPLARSSPALFVVALSFAVGRGAQIGHLCVAGIVLVVAGAFLLPMTRFRDIRLENYLRLSGLLALLAALGTAGYSMIDDTALRSLRNSPAMPLGVAQVTLVYSFFEGLSTSFWLALSVLAWPARRATLGDVLDRFRGTAALTGVGMYLGYTLVLISMAYVANVSYVVAFRQTSILFGALLGVLVLKEPRRVPKLVGVALLFVGLILIATG